MREPDFPVFCNARKYQTIFKKPDNDRRFSHRTCSFRSNSGKLYRPAPFGCPASDRQSNRPCLPQNLPCQQTEPGRNMAAASPSSTLASSEFSATAFSPKETQKQKARTIKQRYGLSAFSRHDWHPFVNQVLVHLEESGGAVDFEVITPL